MRSWNHHDRNSRIALRENDLRRVRDLFTDKLLGAALRQFRKGFVDLDNWMLIGSLLMLGGFVSMVNALEANRPASASE